MQDAVVTKGSPVFIAPVGDRLVDMTSWSNFGVSCLFAMQGAFTTASSYCSICVDPEAASSIDAHPFCSWLLASQHKPAVGEQ
jgi:hypothetical protein